MIHVTEESSLGRIKRGRHLRDAVVKAVRKRNLNELNTHHEQRQAFHRTDQGQEEVEVFSRMTRKCS